MASFSSLKSAIFEREERKQQYQAQIRGLNAYDRHKKFLNDYVAFYGKEKSQHVKLPVKTDQDTLREGYWFIRSEEDDQNPSWEQRLVKRYYDKLFKEYCIADMSQYKSGKIGLRWRTEKEVISGKGKNSILDQQNYNYYYNRRPNYAHQRSYNNEFQASDPVTRSKVVNVNDYGAKADGTDDSQV
ncbi:hypothetical protein SLEP1_g2872 [Rubroshorea leprosula]|uniref:Uncharacterized protein n=1 Tax=Rubroshorea leprosula TaxID=152421 RepID=A0AAV5HPE0_9ROSI|nr:hypothetical protein SLEP1_g2872 [Rubroshorea leprosula]